MYEVILLPESVYEKVVSVELDQYTRYQFHLSSIEVSNGIPLNDLIDLYNSFMQIYETGKYREMYIGLDFETELVKAFQEFTGDWEDCMVCELKVDTLALLKDTDEDMTFDDWLRADYFYREEEMEENAEWKEQKHLDS